MTMTLQAFTAASGELPIPTAILLPATILRESLIQSTCSCLWQLVQNKLFEFVLFVLCG